VGKYSSGGDAGSSLVCTNCLPGFTTPGTGAANCSGKWTGLALLVYCHAGQQHVFCFQERRHNGTREKITEYEYKHREIISRILSIFAM
jgi:hypothetical protein